MCLRGQLRSFSQYRRPFDSPLRGTPPSRKIDRSKLQPPAVRDSWIPFACLWSEGSSVYRKFGLGMIQKFARARPTWGQPPSAVRRSRAPLLGFRQKPCRAALDWTAEGGCPHVVRGGYWLVEVNVLEAQALQ